MDNQKATWKSTEFWISLIGVISGLVMAALPESPWANLIGGAMAAICGSSYTIGRSLVKGNREKSTGLLSALKKKPE